MLATICPQARAYEVSPNTQNTAAQGQISTKHAVHLAQTNYGKQIYTPHDLELWKRGQSSQKKTRPSISAQNLLGPFKEARLRSRRGHVGEFDCTSKLDVMWEPTMRRSNTCTLSPHVQQLYIVVKFLVLGRRQDN